MTVESIYHVTGEPDADVMAGKAILVMEIKRLLAERGIKTQQAAADLIGWARPDVAHLLKGKFRGFSIERINGALHALESTARMRIIVEYVSTNEVEQFADEEHKPTMPITASPSLKQRCKGIRAPGPSGRGHFQWG